MSRRILSCANRQISCSMLWSRTLSAEFAPRRSCVAIHIASCFSKLLIHQKKKLSAEFAPRRSCVAVHIASCFSKLRTYMMTHETHMHGIPVARDLLQISYRLAPHTCTCTSGMFTFYREHILHIYTHARHPCCKLLLEADIRTKLSYMLPETELQTCYTDASFCFIHDTRIHHTCCSSFSKMLNPKP
jgi:hypothetical protein